MTAVEDGAPLHGHYEEARGYRVVDGRPLVLSEDVFRTATETKIGGESADPDAWAGTVTVTRVAQEADDTD